MMSVELSHGAIQLAANFVELIAFATLIFGLFFSLLVSVRAFRQSEGYWGERLSGPFLTHLRLTLGRWLLAGLEVLIISDVLHSIVHRTLNDVGILAGIVLIRVVLAYFLDREIERIAPFDTPSG